MTRNTQPNRFRQAGYGFFAGFAVLFLAITTVNALTGSVSWKALIVFLSVFCAGGGVAVWRSHRVRRIIHPVPQISAGPALKMLTVLALALIAIHLLFIAIEIFTQPVYPWDSWAVWAYRAKAWFFNGGMVEFVSPAHWLAASSADAYTTNAWNYPQYASVVPYWAALSLGRWSETLTNLPVLFAGLAIGLALYGQCREYGFSVSISIIACYLLYSIPIFGTHLALAGYADIWMAGFVGLGFMSIISGTIKDAESGKPGFSTVLGYLMIGFGMMVKNEGLVWFLSALLMLAVMTYKPRTLVVSAIITSSIFWLGYLWGFREIEIPLIGTLGYSDGKMIIPLIGSIVLEQHDVWQAYWRSFITAGNWNLLWILVTASLLSVAWPVNTGDIGSRQHQLKRACLSFILILVATQLFIFGFTEQGRWALTFTAINRLPLQFTPALLFAAFVLVDSALSKASQRASVTETQNDGV